VEARSWWPARSPARGRRAALARPVVARRSRVRSSLGARATGRRSALVRPVVASTRCHGRRCSARSRPGCESRLISRESQTTSDGRPLARCARSRVACGDAPLRRRDAGSGPCSATRCRGTACIRDDRARGAALRPRAAPSSDRARRRAPTARRRRAPATPLAWRMSKTFVLHEVFPSAEALAAREHSRFPGIRPAEI